VQGGSWPWLDPPRGGLDMQFKPHAESLVLRKEVPSFVITTTWPRTCGGSGQLWAIIQRRGGWNTLAADSCRKWVDTPARGRHLGQTSPAYRTVVPKLQCVPQSPGSMAARVRSENTERPLTFEFQISNE
jgi:hypothetical protein